MQLFPTLVEAVDRKKECLGIGGMDRNRHAEGAGSLWVGNRSYLLRESLAQLERRVGEHGFVRAHRQALVRVDAVRALQSNDAGDVTALLACGARIWNCDGRPDTGRADTPMPYDVSPR